MPNASRIAGSRQYGGVLILTVRLNGWDFKLLADTGAAFMVITKDAANLLGIDLRHLERMEKVIVASKTIGRAPVINIREVKVGGYQVNDLEALVLEFPPELRIDGLLGVNFLERFRPTFEFDIATLVLRGHK
ncbi:retroviral-like aspartic protease family protein [Dehalococcoidia bacterium]|nr:retroviral-like aspartic protease family protein [Dehalococcoidia bacterium]